jgi:hypothetical protein
MRLPTRLAAVDHHPKPRRVVFVALKISPSSGVRQIRASHCHM